MDNNPRKTDGVKIKKASNVLLVPENGAHIYGKRSSYKYPYTWESAGTRRNANRLEAAYLQEACIFTIKCQSPFGHKDEAALEQYILFLLTALLLSEKK